MTAITSTRFASASAAGENWRDIAKSVIDQIQAIRTERFRPTIGFVYMTQQLAADAQSILTLLRAVTEIEHWSGCAAAGICANGVEYTGLPALSVMVGEVPDHQVRYFHAQNGGYKKLHAGLEPWLNRHDPMLVVLHADPNGESHPAQAIEEVESMVGGFMVGGLSSARGVPSILAKDALHGGISGFVFSQDFPVATSISQGCVPIGPQHDISKADDHVIGYLDGKPPFDVLSGRMTTFAEKKFGDNPADHLLETGRQNTDPNKLVNADIHVAFPVTGTDKADFLVRNIIAIDPESGAIAVGENLEDGQKILFVQRDDETVRSDLSSMLVNLRQRVLHDRGEFAPKAALYVSCVARLGVSFLGNGKAGGEMSLLREVLGEIPITGFYAAGEISNNRLYGYTGVLTLFF